MRIYDDYQVLEIFKGYKVLNLTSPEEMAWASLVYRIARFIILFILTSLNTSSKYLQPEADFFRFDRRFQVLHCQRTYRSVR